MTVGCLFIQQLDFFVLILMQSDAIKGYSLRLGSDTLKDLEYYP